MFYERGDDHWHAGSRAGGANGYSNVFYRADYAPALGWFQHQNSNKMNLVFVDGHVSPTDIFWYEYPAKKDASSPYCGNPYDIN